MLEGEKYPEDAFACQEGRQDGVMHCSKKNIEVGGGIS